MWLTRMLLMACILWASACAPQEPVWTRPQASPRVLELDRVDCAMSAQEMGRSASFDKRRIVPDVAWRSYLNCMAGRGWRAAPLDMEQAGGQAEPQGPCACVPSLAGTRIVPPEGFDLLERFTRAIGPADSCVFVYRDQRAAHLRLEIQRATDGFRRTDAPVEPTFVLVDRGAEAMAGGHVSWAASAGRRNSVDMAVFTALVLAQGGKERLAVSLAAPVPGERGSVQAGLPGLRLPHAQREFALELAQEWRGWLARGLTER